MPGEEKGLFDFWNGGANLLIWGLQFGSGQIIWGLKIRGPKCTICVMILFIFSQLWLTSHPRSTKMCFLWSEFGIGESFGI